MTEFQSGLGGFRFCEQLTTWFHKSSQNVLACARKYSWTFYTEVMKNFKVFALHLKLLISHIVDIHNLFEN